LTSWFSSLFLLWRTAAKLKVTMISIFFLIRERWRNWKLHWGFFSHIQI